MPMHPFNLVGIHIWGAPLPRSQANSKSPYWSESAPVSVTALHTQGSNSVAVKVSGLYSSTHSVCGCCAANSLIKRTAFTAMLRTSSRLILNTVSRKFSDVALYTCTIARFAPRSPWCGESSVPALGSTPQGKTLSAGICWPSINWRTKNRTG